MENEPGSHESKLTPLQEREEKLKKEVAVLQEIMDDAFYALWKMREEFGKRSDDELSGEQKQLVEEKQKELKVAQENLRELQDELIATMRQGAKTYLLVDPPHDL